MVNTNELYNKMKKWMQNNPELHKKEYIKLEEMVSNSTAYYHGKPVSFFYQPMLFNKDQIDLFTKKINIFNGILKKVTRRYLSDERFRSFFDFPSLMEELIMVDPGYEVEYPVARFDFFYDYEDQFKFCELNTDGSSAMNEARVLQRDFQKSKLIKEFNSKYNFEGYELFYSLINKILENYNDFAGGKAKKYPNIGIMDFMEDGTTNEFEEFKKRFKELGYETVICDPRNLKYEDGKLWADELPLDLIYRRATTARVVENGEKIIDFINAYKNKDVCVVGGFRSQIPHNKLIFAALHDDNLVDFLNVQEKEFIKDHIPWTVCFDPDDERLFNKVLKNKHKFVLKPCDMFAGKGVYVGKDYNFEKWKKILEDINTNNDYLVQEFIDQPELKMGFVKNDKFEIDSVNYILGLFLYNQEISGLYARGGRKNIIAPAGESRTMPCFVVKE